MKMSPIINLLATNLPLHTDYFNDSLSVLSILVSGTTATVTTSTPHLLTTGEFIILRGAIEQTTIDSLVFDPLTNYVTARTTVDCGLTTRVNFKNRGVTPITVEVSGAIEPEYNGEFKLIDVPNRNAFIYEIPSVPASSPATGVLRLSNYSGALDRFNTVHPITVVDSDEFTITLESKPSGEDNSPLGTILTQVRTRISAAITSDRALDTYTKLTKDSVNANYWLFCIPGDFFISKDRNVATDAVTTTSSTADMFQKAIESVDLLIVAPCIGITSRQAYDNIEDIKLALIKSLLGVTQVQQYNLNQTYNYVIRDARLIAYNTSFIAYQFTFETIYDINNSDMNAPFPLSPLRDLSGNFMVKDNPDDIFLGVDLDVDPDF